MALPVGPVASVALERQVARYFPKEQLAELDPVEPAVVLPALHSNNQWPVLLVYSTRFAGSSAHYLVFGILVAVLLL